MAQQLPQPLHDGQAKAETEAPLARRVVDLMVLLEDRLKFRLGNADAGVPYLDAQHAFAPTAAEQNLAPPGVFHCVGEQVANHLLEQTWIAADHEAARDHPQDKSLGLSVIGELIPQPFEQIVDREIRPPRRGRCRPRSG